MKPKAAKSTRIRSLAIDALERRSLLSATAMEHEPNDSQATATEFSLPADGEIQLVGALSSTEDRDFFRFTPVESGSIEVTGLAGSSVSMEVENSLDQDVFETEPKDGVTAGQFRVSAGLTYSVRLKHADVAGTMDYAAQLAFTAGTPAGNGDANGDQICDMHDFAIMREEYGRSGHSRGDLNGDSKVDLKDFAVLRNQYGKRYHTEEHDHDDEAGDENQDSVAVSFNEAGELIIDGVSAGHDDKDFYVFTAPASGKVDVSVSSSNGNAAAVEIETASDVEVLEIEPNDGVFAGSFQAVEGVRYFLRARSTNAGDAAYSISLKLTADTGGGNNGGGNNGGGNSGGNSGGEDPGPAVVVTELEPNNSQSRSNAFLLAPHIELHGSIENHDDRDFFRFVPSANGSLTVSVAPDSGINVEMERYYAVDDVLELEPHDGVTTATVDVVAGALYYLRVRGQRDAVTEYSVDLVFATI